MIADEGAICARSEQHPSWGTFRLPILLIASQGRLPQLDCQSSERILGYLSQPFKLTELSNMLGLVQRNMVEFDWLDRQCQTYKDLLQRLHKRCNPPLHCHTRRTAASG